MLRRLSGVLVVAVILLGFAFSVQAQGDGPEVYCGTLSEADCNILVQSQAAMKGLSAAAFDMNMGITVDSPSPDMQIGRIALAAQGAFGADQEALATFEEMTPEQMAELMTATPEMITDLVRSVTGELNLSVELPQELASEADIPMTSLTLELLMTDGVVYANVGALMGAAGGADTPSWMGIDLGSMLESMVSEASTSMGEMGDMEAFLNSEAMHAMYDTQSFDQFVTITRAADAEVMGQTVAVFETSLDYDALFTSDVFKNYLDEFMTMQGEMGAEVPENFDEIMATIAQGITFNVTEQIGLEDYYVHHTEVVMTFDMDFEALKEVVPELAAEDVPENFSFSFDMTLDLSAFNEPVVVTAPEGAQVINPMMFMDVPPSKAG